MPTNLPPAIDALLSAGARRFTVPMEPQPNPPSWACYGPSWNHDRTGIRWIGENPNGSTVFADEWPKPNIIPPYPPGTVLPVREEWCDYTKHVRLADGGRMPKGYGCVAYKSDLEVRQYGIALKEPESFTATEKVRWRPAETMPDWAARRHVVVTECRPVRVEEKWCWDVSVEPKQ